MFQVTYEDETYRYEKLFREEKEALRYYLNLRADDIEATLEKV